MPKDCEECGGKGYRGYEYGWGQCLDCEGGVASRGPEPATPPLVLVGSEVQSVLAAAPQSDGCQANYNAGNDHYVPLSETGKHSGQLYSSCEKDAETSSD